MGSLFHEILYRPLFNGLIYLYQTVAIEDFGLAIIFLTLIIRIIFYPLFYKSFRNQILLQKIQPEIKKIQKDNKHNREAQAQALLALYKMHKVNPFSSFFLILIQLPILIALYRVFLNGFSVDVLPVMYSFISEPTMLSPYFFNLINLEDPNILIVGFAALAQYFQGKLSLARNTGKSAQNKEVSMTERLGKQMVFFGPILTVVILFSLPAAIGIYWLTTSVFSIGQQYIISRSLDKKTNNEPISGQSEKTP